MSIPGRSHCNGQFGGKYPSVGRSDMVPRLKWRLVTRLLGTGQIGESKPVHNVVELGTNFALRLDAVRPVRDGDPGWEKTAAADQSRSLASLSGTT
jgi:hypothetical protein